MDNDFSPNGLEFLYLDCPTRKRLLTARLKYDLTHKAIKMFLIAWLITSPLYLSNYISVFNKRFSLYCRLMYNIVRYIRFLSCTFSYTLMYINHSLFVFNSHLCKYYRKMFQLTSYNHSKYILPLTLTCTSICLNSISISIPSYNSANKIYLGVSNRETVTLFYNITGKSKTYLSYQYYRRICRVLAINSIFKSCDESITNSRTLTFCLLLLLLVVVVVVVVVVVNGLKSLLLLLLLLFLFLSIL